MNCQVTLSNSLDVRAPGGGPLPHRNGFTLIEVLIAMVILAVGLLGLEALGVVAVRSLGFAERNSRASVTAARYVEEALEQVRRNERPASFTCTLASGDRIQRAITYTPPANATAVARVSISVTVTPRPTSSTPIPVTVSSYAYSPDPLPEATAYPCPS